MDKIELGEPYHRNGYLNIPFKFNYPEGGSDEATLTMPSDSTIDYAIDEAKKLYIEYRKRRVFTMPKSDIDKIKGMKINDVY